MPTLRQGSYGVVCHPQCLVHGVPRRHRREEAHGSCLHAAAAEGCESHALERPMAGAMQLQADLSCSGCVALGMGFAAGLLHLQGLIGDYEVTRRSDTCAEGDLVDIAT
eukprot:9086159-Alexandrium_andersonii.AAC.1